jgi:beta-lactamase superfamily II metal-dependent hydrolase
MRRSTVIMLVILAVAALVMLATIGPMINDAVKGKNNLTSIKALSNDSTTATLALNETGSGSLELNGANITVIGLDTNTDGWNASWTVSASAWLESVQKLTSRNLSLIIIDQDRDRRMGMDDRIVVKRELNGSAPSVAVSFNIKFADGLEAGCGFTYPATTAVPTVVSFLDVDEGDSILIRTADLHTILIDAGPPLASGALISYLHNRSVTVIDALIITHPDADHLGGASEVLRKFPVLSIYHPGVAKSTYSYSSFIQAAQNEGCPIHTAADVHVGDYLDLTASVTFEVLNIDPDAEDVNDASIVLEMRTPGKSFLFTGDATSEVEKKLIANHSMDLNVDVLKVAHHGSKTSTSNAFLDATSPTTAVISVGVNDYGYPKNDTMARLFAHDVTVLRTDQMGTIEIVA